MFVMFGIYYSLVAFIFTCMCYEILNIPKFSYLFSYIIIYHSFLGYLLVGSLQRPNTSIFYRAVENIQTNPIYIAID
uniref:Putative secreted peptide n=1 Tax=Anopheles braziliensis TaxID=58242 RepID=A0A2M3ZVN8_9DIPT